jgi:uncharacterized membrane protein
MKYIIVTTALGFAVLSLLFGGMWIAESVRVAWLRPILMAFGFCFATGMFVRLIRDELPHIMANAKGDV